MKIFVFNTLNDASLENKRISKLMGLRGNMQAFEIIEDDINGIYTIRDEEIYFYLNDAIFNERDFINNDALLL